MNLTKSVLAVSLGIASVGYAHLLDTTASSTPAAPAAKPEATPEAGVKNWRQATWEISVTNITRGQIFSPPVVATHDSSMTPLWTLGEKASPELAAVAEDALNAGLIAKLRSSRNVANVAEIKGANGPILPGETAKIRIRGGRSRFGNFDRISMVGMLVITNDAFFGLNGVAAPWRGSTSVRSAAYDAGSEANNEDCAFIPGPPCGNAMVRATAGAEGYVHIHAGIHGIKSLAPERYDWRNDVAQITIRRVR